MDIVEQIHREVDTAQDRLMAEANAMIEWYNKLAAEIKEPTLSLDEKLSNKASMLEKYGFSNTPEVVYRNKKTIETEAQKKAVKEQKEKLAAETKLLVENNELLLQLTKAYPFEKILTVKELDRICAKYKLVYAQVDRYKKTVPDKNLNDIAKAKPLNVQHSNDREFSIHFPNMAFKDEQEYSIYNFYKGAHHNKTFSSEEEANRWIESIKYDLRTRYTFSNISLTITDKTGLFIAAPKSHFDLKGLEKIGFGFFKVKVIPEPKDPIVFQFLKGGFVRVITKWGLEADEPSLSVPVLN